MIAYAKSVEKTIRSNQEGSTAWLASPNTSLELQSQISKIYDSNDKLPGASQRCEELDRLGTTLFNKGTRLKRGYDDEEGQDMAHKILVELRVFAFLLLDCAWTHGKKQPGHLSRILRTCLKVAKTCLGR